MILKDRVKIKAKVIILFLA